MNKLLIILAIMTLAVAPVKAATTRERECHTDSYGNTTCRDKITNLETGVITYSNETVTVSSGTTNVSTGTIGSTGTVTTTGTNGELQILNTAVPTPVSYLAALLVATGAVAMLVKQARRHA